MFISEQTLDDLMHSVLTELLKRPFDVVSSRSRVLGASSEVIGIMLHLQNPRHRLSRDEGKGTIFSGLGELLWYLSGSNKLDFISYYLNAYNDESEDGITIYGAYGPRLLNFRHKVNQIDNIIKLLKSKPTSRKAVIQIFDAKDLVGVHKEIPCTCSLQFFVRDEKLHMLTSMRSNDAYRGLPHDVFAFTMIQEIIAHSIDVELGEYHHSVGSLHLYEKDKVKASEYLDAGFHSTLFPMPKMPLGQPWPSLKRLLTIENIIRTGKTFDPNCYTDLNTYWMDLARLLHAFSISRKNLGGQEVDQLKIISKSFAHSGYDTYITKKIDEIKYRRI